MILNMRLETSHAICAAIGWLLLFVGMWFTNTRLQALGFGLFTGALLFPLLRAVAKWEEGR